MLQFHGVKLTAYIATGTTTAGLGAPRKIPTATTGVFANDVAIAGNGDVLLVWREDEAGTALCDPLSLLLMERSAR